MPSRFRVIQRMESFTQVLYVSAAMHCVNIKKTTEQASGN